MKLEVYSAPKSSNSHKYMQSLETPLAQSTDFVSRCQLAEKYLEEENYIKANELFDSLLYIAPDNREILINKAAALRGLSRSREARQVLTKALKKFPKDKIILSKRAMIFRERKLYKKSLEDLDKIINSDPDNEEAYLHRCVIFRLQHAFNKAEMELNRLLAKNPGSNAIYLESARLDEAQRNYDSALATLHKILDSVPNERDAIEMYISILRSKGNIQEAQIACDLALNSAPDNARLLCQRGYIAEIQGDLELAYTCYLKASENRKPAFLAPEFRRVEILKRRNSTEEAQKLLEHLKKKRPDDFEIRNQLGWFFLCQNKLVQARQEFESMNVQDRFNYLAKNGLGLVAFFEERFSEAEEQFRLAVKRDFNNEVFNSNLAWSLVKQIDNCRIVEDSGFKTWSRNTSSSMAVGQRSQLPGDLLREAKKYCRKALEINPFYPDALNCQGVIAYKYGNLIEAEDLFKKAIQLSKDATHYVNLGALYMQMGRYDDAIRTLKTARKLDRTDMRARLELGNIYLQSDKITQAILIFREAMAVNPNSSAPPRALAIALMRIGDFAEAGRVLRKAISSLDQSKCWQLHLTLCRLLTDLADKSDDPELYNEALKEALLAIALKPNESSPYFYAGIVHCKLEDYGHALKHFRECLRRDPDHFDAEQNERRIRSLLRQERIRTRGSKILGVTLGIMCAGLLVILWYLYFTTKEKITPTIFNTLTPILLGMIFVAFLMPWLIKLKLPGMEAELSRPKEKVSSGLTGPISFGASSLSAGPK